MFVDVLLDKTIINRVNIAQNWKKQIAATFGTNVVDFVINATLSLIFWICRVLIFELKEGENQISIGSQRVTW